MYVCKLRKDVRTAQVKAGGFYTLLTLHATGRGFLVGDRDYLIYVKDVMFVNGCVGLPGKSATNCHPTQIWRGSWPYHSRQSSSEYHTSRAIKKPFR